jgi:hypothetical protein
MPERNPYWPKAPRAYVAYNPPFGVYQPARWDALRDVWSGVQEFCARTASPIGKSEHVQISACRWSAARTEDRPDMDEYPGPWPAELTQSDFDEATELARRTFGAPRLSSKTGPPLDPVFEEEHRWLVPIARLDEVLEYVERVKHCTVGGLPFPPIHASYTVPFRLRDLRTGAVLRGQTSRHYPRTSQLDVILAQRCSASLQLVMPFAEPDESVVEYVMALQEHAPVWMDPRYFDHMVPEPEGSEHLYRRRRLSPEWVGRTASGEPRLDVLKSGIVPKSILLPTEEDIAREDREADLAPYRDTFYAVYGALREHTAAALLLRGPFGSAREFMVEESAKQLGMPVHVMRTGRTTKGAPSVAEELRTLVWSLEDRPAVLLVELVAWGDRAASDAVLAQMATRTLDRATLPSAVRLVVLEQTAGSEETRQAEDREDAAHQEGFATREQLEYLERQHAAAAYRDVELVRVPHAP